MSFLADVFSPIRALFKVANAAPVLIQPWQSGKAALPNLRYETLAREGYAGNEVVYACVEELSTSAAEPPIKALVGGEWTREGDVVDLLERPNPFMDRFEFFATVIMYRAIAGNAYALKVRSGSGRVRELWLLRPDRVKVVPSETRYISHYEYQFGQQQAFILPVEDVIHWKTRNPIDPFYGMPPLFPLSGRVDIDNFMRDFVKAFFENAGVPAGILSLKTGLSAENRDEIRSRFRNTFGGPRGWHELVILDNTESSYTPVTMQLGQRGLVVPELNQASEARICMVFGVPPSLIGAEVGMGNSSYANLVMQQRFFWDNTLAPLYAEIAGRLTMGLIADFPGVDEIAFDLSEVRALQDDVDQVWDRMVKGLGGGIVTIEEARLKLGLPATANAAEHFLLPLNVQPVKAGMIDEIMEEPEEEPMPVASRNGSTPRV